MSWSRLNAKEPILAFASKAIDAKGISEDIKIVIDNMIKNRARDNATEATQLLYFINATNGYINIGWCDFESDKYAGDWTYWVELKDFWESGDDDAISFNNTCNLAIFIYASDHLVDDNDEYIYESYIRTEISEAEMLEI